MVNFCTHVFMQIQNSNGITFENYGPFPPKFKGIQAVRTDSSGPVPDLFRDILSDTFGRPKLLVKIYVNRVHPCFHLVTKS